MRKTIGSIIALFVISTVGTTALQWQKEAVQRITVSCMVPEGTYYPPV